MRISKLELRIENLEGFFLKGGIQSICRLNVQKLTFIVINLLTVCIHKNLIKFC